MSIKREFQVVIDLEITSKAVIPAVVSGNDGQRISTTGKDVKESVRL